MKGVGDAWREGTVWKDKVLYGNSGRLAPSPDAGSLPWLLMTRIMKLVCLLHGKRGCRQNTNDAARIQMKSEGAAWRACARYGERGRRMGCRMGERTPYRERMPH